MTSLIGKKEIIAFLKEEIASTINQHIDSIDEAVSFLKLGVSSIQAISIINNLRKKLEIDSNATMDISPIVMFTYNTLTDFASYLDECLVSTAAVVD